MGSVNNRAVIDRIIESMASKYTWCLFIIQVLSNHYALMTYNSFTPLAVLQLNTRILPLPVESIFRTLSPFSY